MANSTKISEYSTTAANNTSIDSIDIDENCAASGINNAIRSVLKHQADAFTQGTPIALDQTNNRVGIGTTSPNVELEISGSSEMLRLQSTDTNKASIVGRGASADRWLLGTVASNDSVTLQATNSTGELLFKTGGTNERMRIASGGNVGIGTTSPDQTLHVHKGSAGAVNSASNSVITVENNADAYIQFLTPNTNQQQIRFGDPQDTGNGILSYNHSDNSMRFATNGPEKMRLAASGDLLLGTTTTIGPAQFNVDGSSQCGIGIRAGNGTSGYFNQVLFANNGNTALIGSIQRVNNASIQYNTTSDARLKENIADMTGAIARVKQLMPKRYSWVDEDLDAADQDGFLAHEAQTVVPGAVSGTQDEVDDDGNAVHMQMDYSKLVPLLTGALKEAITKIETLETEMTALKARVTALEA